MPLMLAGINLVSSLLLFKFFMFFGSELKFRVGYNNLKVFTFVDHSYLLEL